MTRENNPSRLAVDLTAVVVAMRDNEPHVLTIQAPDSPRVALPSGPLQDDHRTLQAGLRSWVETQTGQPLGYVEQLYTFGDRQSPLVDATLIGQRRTISIAYLALVSVGGDSDPRQGRWRSWYEFFPWEDHRRGQPPAAKPLLQQLDEWAQQADRLKDPECRERARLTFGIDNAPWDEERALERYEMLYEADLVPEAAHDADNQPTPEQNKFPGQAMHADHRRILSTAISRLRAKIKYRPVLFELMPESFTLLHLQRTAEAISGAPLHKQNFRRLVAHQNLVEETGELASGTGGRPAKLMRFRKEVTLERPAPGVRLRATRRGGYP